MAFFVYITRLSHIVFKCAIFTYLYILYMCVFTYLYILYMCYICVRHIVFTSASGCLYIHIYGEHSVYIYIYMVNTGVYIYIYMIYTSWSPHILTTIYI